MDLEKLLPKLLRIYNEFEKHPFLFKENNGKFEYFFRSLEIPLQTEVHTVSSIFL